MERSKSRRRPVACFQRRGILSTCAPGTLALVPAHQLALRQDVTFHGPLQLGLGRPRAEVGLGIEGVELEEVAVRSARRGTRTAVPDPAKIVAPLARAVFQLPIFWHVFGKLAHCRG